MKESVRDRLNLGEIKILDILKEAARHILCLGLGFLTAHGSVLGQILPFGLAFAAAVPADYLAAAAFGSFIGYMFPPIDTVYFRYLAALLAIVAIKALLSIVTKLASRPILCAITAGIVTLFTGLVTTVGDTRGSVLSVCEAVLALSGAYFISKAFSLKGVKNGLKGLELACLLITVNIGLLGLMSFAPSGISVGAVFAVCFILLASRFGHPFSGAVCGVISGFAAALSGLGANMAISLSVAGLICGIFSSLGKYAQVAAFILSAVVASSVELNLADSAAVLITSLFGAALFLIIPKTVAQKAGKLLSPPTKTALENGMKKTVTMRLNFAASALADVSDTVETVAKELSRINTPDFNWVLNGIETEACSGCSLCTGCWETKKPDTVSSMLEIIKSIKEGSSLEKIIPPEDFLCRCLRPDKVKQAVFKYYSDYASRMAAESRIADVRSVVSEQFSGISSMLRDMATDLDREEAFDDRLAAKISEALKNIDIRPDECCCRVDRYGRMTVEIIVKEFTKTNFSRMKLLRQIEICCDRDFEPPIITRSGGKIFITVTEKAELSLNTGVYQIAASPSGISGDAYSTFLDSKGRAFILLSDGMGTGGRAAVDGAMASGLMTRLIKAGFGFDSSLSILNSAMLFKSTDESLATIDLSCVDLFSGRVDLLKAGAAPTIIRRNGKCGVAKSTSLPVGILREVGFDRATLKLKPGDVLVLMSDGATGEGTDWICAEIEAFRQSDPKLLAEHLAHSAKRRRTDNHNDDITVMVAIIERAV